MNQARRSFISYLSILSFLGFGGFALQASPLSVKQPEDLYNPHDEHFDPDGWL